MVCLELIVGTNLDRLTGAAHRESMAAQTLRWRADHQHRSCARWVRRAHTVDRLLRGVIQNVARRVVLEGFAVGCWQAGLGKGLPCRFLDPSGGVIAMAGIAIQAVAALAQFALTEKAFCLGRPAAV